VDVTKGQQDGAEIRRLRRRLGIGRAEFAERAGLKPSSLTNIENGNRAPSLDALTSIAHALDVPLAVIVKAGTPLHAALTRASREDVSVGGAS
jgi:transcriptional regulator with XRE-family HTH domain